jgi:hypothetical protein
VDSQSHNLTVKVMHKGSDVTLRRLSRQPSLGFRRVTSSRLSDALSPLVSGNLDSSVNLMDADTPLRGNERLGSVGSGGMTPMQGSGPLFSLGSGLGSGTMISEDSLGSSMPMSPGPPTPAPITGAGAFSLAVCIVLWPSVMSDCVCAHVWVGMCECLCVVRWYRGSTR